MLRFIHLLKRVWLTKFSEKNTKYKKLLFLVASWISISCSLKMQYAYMHKDFRLTFKLPIVRWRKTNNAYLLKKNHTMTDCAWIVELKIFYNWFKIYLSFMKAGWVDQHAILRCHTCTILDVLCPSLFILLYFSIQFRMTWFDNIDVWFVLERLLPACFRKMDWR